jgi:hypothetical protein
MLQMYSSLSVTQTNQIGWHSGSAQDSYLGGAQLVY